MAKYYRGDTLPITVSYNNYTFKQGDVVTVGIFDEDMTKLAEKSLTVVGECDAVQIELSKEDMHDVLGKCIIEARTITAEGVEMTIQDNAEFKEDGLR